MTIILGPCTTRTSRQEWSRPAASVRRNNRRNTPADAVVLFDGTDLSKWEADQGTGVPTKWVAKNGAMECVPGSGYVRTKESIGDCQLHVEWAAPTKVEGNGQGRGNSGVFLMGLVKIQVPGQLQQPDLPGWLRRFGLWRQSPAG